MVQFKICKAFEIPLKSLLGQIYNWTSSWRLKWILLGPISYRAATPGPPPRAIVLPSPPPWAARAQGKPMHRRPNPDASRAKQVPLPPPLLAPSPASHRVSGPTPMQAKQSKCRCPCENIRNGYLFVMTQHLLILKGIYSFKFPQKNLEISSRDLTLLSILII